MKLNENKETEGLFILENNYYAGKIIFSHNNPVKIIITTNIRIFGLNFKYKQIGRIIGSIKETNERITILDGIIHESLWSSNGIIEYTIRSNLIIIGENINKKTINIPNLHLMFPDLNDYFGNNLTEAKFNIKEKIVDLSMQYDKTISELNSLKHGIKVKIKAFYNIDKYNLRNKFEVKQLNSIVLEFKKSKEIYSSLKYVFLIETLLSFIFQNECTVDEVVYFKKSKDTVFNHIYFKHQICKNDNNKVLFERKYLIENICKFIINWIEITKEIKYLQYFMLYYYKNKYIDQRIIAQVNLIEAFHRYYFGTKKVDPEIEANIKRIVPQINNKNDREYVENLIKSKNSYGLKRKIYDISLKSKITSFTKEEIETIIKIRSTLSHGSTNETMNFDKLAELCKKLNEMIISIIKYEIDK
jgi:hypothetical protein